jgi:hypothetical protein
MCLNFMYHSVLDVTGCNLSGRASSNTLKLGKHLMMEYRHSHATVAHSRGQKIIRHKYLSFQVAVLE